jgi:hypothetical protein
MNAPASPFSALPPWLQDVLPAWFRSHIPFTEALWAAWISMRNGVAIMLAAAWIFAPVSVTQAGPITFLDFVCSKWWVIGAPLFFAWLRSKTAHAKASIASPGQTPP